MSTLLEVPKLWARDFCRKKIPVIHRYVKSMLLGFKRILEPWLGSGTVVLFSFLLHSANAIGNAEKKIKDGWKLKL